MTPSYIHQHPDWPNFRWNRARLEPLLGEVRHRQGRMAGRMEALGFQLRAEAVLATLTEDVLKSSEIEGERLDKGQVRSSIARRLGMDVGGIGASDRDVEGVVEMMLDATQNYESPLTAERLHGWHAALFPTGWSGLRRIAVGAWRTGEAGPMQVVSGPVGRERVHYEAPGFDRVQGEMKAFLDWFNGEACTDPVIKAGVAHLWFVTIHPFEDGNGRIARAVADMLLARAERSRQRFYSLSAQIRRERGDYYRRLERVQKGGLDITDWLEWFLACLDKAVEGAEAALSDVLRKARFWDRMAGVPISARQRGVLNRLLDGFQGGITTSKWATLAGCSQDTALRDIEDLIGKGVLVKGAAGGRSTAYALADIADGS